MLDLLRIRNIAIVEDLTLRLGGGLNVLTGETGAGKSILVDSLGLLLGDRANGDLLRAGTTRGSVEGVFRIDLDRGAAEDLRAMLGRMGLEPEGEDVIVRRELELVKPERGDAGGGQVRSRQYLGDSPVPLATLKRFGDLLVEIQGQHEHHALLGADVQRRALDRFASAGDEVAELGSVARKANAAADGLEELEARLADRQARLEILAYHLLELDQLAPSGGDEADLRAARGRLASAEKRREIAGRLHLELYEEDGSILDRLGTALAGVRLLAELDPEREADGARLEGARDAIAEVALGMREYREASQADPAQLEMVEERLALYERLARKHGVSSSGLAELRARLADEAADLNRHEERHREAREAVERLRSEYLELARRLSGRRKEAAARLAVSLRRELASLAMERCAVEVDAAPEDPGPGARLREEGTDEVRLRIAPNPGEASRDLASVASGGELSRVMLAVNVALGSGRKGRTLVFDEVDAGIGGRVAQVVGEKLAALAEHHQVVVITHLPQVAALAERHVVVEKEVQNGRTVARVRDLDRRGRVGEIARMMGGKDVSAIARRHASEMLKRSADRVERRSP